MVRYLIIRINNAKSVPKDVFTICQGIRKLKELQASKLKGKMLHKGNDESKRHPSLQKIKRKRALPFGNINYGKHTLSFGFDDISSLL
jgi:hypothetical protein